MTVLGLQSKVRGSILYASPCTQDANRGSSDMGSTEPVDFGKRVLEPDNFLGGKTDKDKNSKVDIFACFLTLIYVCFMEF